MAKKKNLLFVFADQWRNKTLGFNDPEVLTPHFDAFRRESVMFRNAVSTCPVCSPYRACLFTGEYPVQNGVYGNCMTGYDIALRETDDCISDILYRNGYHTGYVGKWHLDQPDLNFSDAPISGATGWDAYTPEGPRRHHFEYWHAYNACNEHMHEHYWENTPEKIFSEEWSPIHDLNKAIEYMDSVKDDENPFALFLAWNPPHTPFDQVPQKYLDLYQGKKLHMRNVHTNEFVNHTGEIGFSGLDLMQEKTKQYYACVSGLDDQFGRLVEYLKRNGLYDDTLIVLTADHGEHLGSHGYVGKHTWYEESVNIPMMMRLPSRLIPHDNSSCISSVQLMPTMLSLLGVSYAPRYKDNDISDALIEQRAMDENRSFISGYISREVFIEAARAAGLEPTDMGWRAVRDPRWTYVIFRGYMPNQPVQVLLYDRQEDPDQQEPLDLCTHPYSVPARMLHTLLMEHLREKNPRFAAWAEETLSQYLMA